MSTKSKKEKELYFNAPDTARIEEILRDIKRLSGINRKATRIKLEPCISTVIACLSNNISLRNISKVILIEHKIHAKKDAINEFINRYDLRNRKLKKAANGNDL
jgi:hypothetical protein